MYSLYLKKPFQGQSFHDTSTNYDYDDKTPNTHMKTVNVLLEFSSWLKIVNADQEFYSLLNENVVKIIRFKLYVILCIPSQEM